MNDLVSYYVETSSAHGPAALYRRRPFPERGHRDDELFVPGEDSWRGHDGLLQYEWGRHDWDNSDFYGVHPDEAERVMAWLREAAKVGRDDAGQPPILGGWTVGCAWLVELQGPLSEQTVETVLDRLDMTRRGDLSHWREKELGLRVLRSDEECRWSLDLYRGSITWSLRLRYVRLAPDKQVIDGLRAQIDGLGLEIAREEIDLVDSFPYSERAAKDQPSSSAGMSHKVFVRYQAFLDGQLTHETLSPFREALGIGKEGRITGDTEQEFGVRYLWKERHRLIRLELARNTGGEWFLTLSYQDTPPDPATVDQLAHDIRAAAEQVGLSVRREAHNRPGEGKS